MTNEGRVWSFIKNTRTVLPDHELASSGQELRLFVEVKTLGTVYRRAPAILIGFFSRVK